MTIGNQVRLTGMFSGMDTDALVKAMVSGQQAKIDKLNQSKTKDQWKKDFITDVNAQLKTFRDNYGSLLGKSSLMSKGNFVDFTVEGTTSAFSVRGTSTAKAGDYSLRIQQIATAASMNSGRLTNIIGGLTSADMDKAVSGLEFAGGVFSGDANGKIEFNINGVDFSFSSSDSLKKIMDTVNASEAGVTMSYSQLSDSITLASKTTGAMSANMDGVAFADLSEADAKKALIVSGDTSGFFAHLGLTSVQAGQDALVSVNGGPLLRYDTNNVTLDGMEFEFKRATSGEQDFTLTKNMTSAKEKITSFVEEFNKIVKTLYDAYNEKKEYKYSPLTESMKDDMTEKEIEDWEKMAKSGIMSRDNKLNTLINGLRSAVTSVLGGEGALSSIGIKMSEFRVGEAWSLEIDDAALTKALEENPDKVFNMFAALDDDNSGDGGLMTRINSAMDNYTAMTKQSDLQTLTNSLDDYTKRIKEQEDKMYVMSERYYIQYSKMETAMAKMQSQTNQMTSLFGAPAQ